MLSVVWYAANLDLHCNQVPSSVYLCIPFPISLKDGRMSFPTNNSSRLLIFDSLLLAGLLPSTTILLENSPKTFYRVLASSRYWVNECTTRPSSHANSYRNQRMCVKICSRMRVPVSRDPGDPAGLWDGKMERPDDTMVHNWASIFPTARLNLNGGGRISVRSRTRGWSDYSA